jgi:hypothetical protein
LDSKTRESLERIFNGESYSQLQDLSKKGREQLKGEEETSKMECDF